MVLMVVKSSFYYFTFRPKLLKILTTKFNSYTSAYTKKYVPTNYFFLTYKTKNFYTEEANLYK